jgi:hypothetical protein
MANSLATKKPFTRTRKTTASSLRMIIAGASQLVAGAPTSSAPLARRVKIFISGGTIRGFHSRVSCSLRSEGSLRPRNFSKTAIVAENLLMPVQDSVYDERIICVADLRNEI